jgi:divalent metal cation (Fe/Co/Zn/Cd) transporter
MADMMADREKLKKSIKPEDFAYRMGEDYRYRTVVFAVLGLVLNVIFALFNGVVGLYSQSAWYGTLSAYYILLSTMRFLAVRYERKLEKEEKGKALLAEEIAIYHTCGILFLVMTIALAGMVILMVCEEEGKHYPGFLIYAVATYTFYKITIAVINLVKVRKLQSPLLMAIRGIGYIDACVSILSLQTAMFSSFGEEQELFRKTMNSITGIIVTVFVLCIGIYSVYSARKMKSAHYD